jgi:hypothetical protein
MSLMGKQILLALVALVAAAVFWPSPAAAQFGFPGGIRIMIPGMMFGPGGYHGRGGYRHSSTSSRHHRSHDDDDDDNNASGEVSKADVKKGAVDKATLDKPAGDKSVADKGNTAQPAVSSAVSANATPNPTPAMATGDGHPAEVSAAAYEHGPDLTPER